MVEGWSVGGQIGTGRWMVERWEIGRIELNVLYRIL